MSHEEAKEIKALSDSLGIPVYVAFYRRGLDKFIAIKQMLTDQVIGDVKFVKVTQTNKVAKEYLDKSNLPWRVLPDISGGGIFMDIGTHVLDCLQMFFGEFESIQGYADFGHAVNLMEMTDRVLKGWNVIS